MMRAAKRGSALAHHMEHPRPPGLVKEMDHDGEKKLQALGNAGARVFITRLLKRPVEEHWAADYVLVGHKSPVSAIEAHITVVAHTKYTVRRHDQLSILDMRRQGLSPCGVQTVVVGWRNGWEIVSITVIGSIAHNEGLIQLFAVPIHY